MQLRQRLPGLHAHPQFACAEKILKTLVEQGYPTVFAGGCVRDSLLGHTPKDVDLATAAPPDAVEKAFEHTLAVGKDFGTIVVVEGGHNFEVTTFRKDGPYLDGRHPTHVEFTDMIEDAKRRDFTVNALFYDPLKEEILDFVGGVEDLRQEKLRTVGRAEERFNEDHLRMLRAARFVAQLGFQLDEDALRAIRAQHALIAQVAAERVFNEMKRLLASPYVLEGLTVMQAGKLAPHVWPELATVDLDLLNAYLPFVNWENAFAAIARLSETSSVEPRLRAWKAPKDSIKKVEQQIAGLKSLTNPKSTRADRALVLGSDVFAEVLALAKGEVDAAMVQGWIDEFLKVSGRTGELPRPWLNGQDLLQVGVAPGEKMGQLLKQIYTEQLEGGLASKADALHRLKELTG